MGSPMSIVHNRIQCLKCGDVIESKSVHNYVECSCGSCFVDGGHDYMRIGGDRENWRDLSVWKNDETGALIVH